MNPEDEATIKAAQSGDAEAFEALLERHYDSVYRFAYRWAGDVADAEDIAQLACIKLANTLKQFRFESAFSTWLYRLVINCAKDWVKAQKRHQTEPSEGIAERGGSSTSLESSVQLDQVLRYLASLGEGIQETAILVFGEGMTHNEAADILGVKESTVSWRIHEMRKQLHSNHIATDR